MTYQISPVLQPQQRQVLYGTILGGSSVVRPDRGRNCYLAMRESNQLWLSYKVEQLRDFFKMDGYTIKKDKNTYRCYSAAYPLFNDIYDLFYEDGQKKISTEILDGLNDVAWMVWFLDAGRKTKRKAYLRTHKFGEEGSKIIQAYFNSLDCACELTQKRGRYELVFPTKGAVQLLKTIIHRVPKFMLHRLD